MTAYEIRQNWYNAFVNANKWDSSTIDWGFYPQDLLILCDMHEAGLFQQEIIDLLEDCNFHTECGLMDDGKYTECREAIINEMKEV